MPHPDSAKYKLHRAELPGIPQFTDFIDGRFAFANGMGGVWKRGVLNYYQWLHCIGNWGEEHSMCKKMRWYVERTMHEWWLDKFEDKRKLGFFDHTIHYGIKPYQGFVALYKPVKKNRKGAYEFWLDRNFEPLIAQDACDWKVKAPILHEIFVKGKKPIFDAPAHK